MRVIIIDCYMGVNRIGSLSEYVCVTAEWLVAFPEGLIILILLFSKQ